MCLSPVAHQLWPLCVLGSLFLSRLPQPDRWLQAIRNFFLRSLEEATRADMLAPSRRLHAHCVINPSLCCCLTSTSIPNLFSAKLGAIPHPGRDETARAPPQDCQVSLRRDAPHKMEDGGRALLDLNRYRFAWHPSTR
ncbi:uncharacterized protein FPRO_06230 [Fusarium proliferatum ET1]|uniref:Secreted protein n=1 Tax=Fusarium proliferatum (strain ET1) TaxID=1227346 RepID=A0A1L7VD04_FUSPR|nr:uncharacterized protein FPRO_06230 [Fusarium proliferatum ET1]CZR38579.1 uncharacterized protein FPRO_06230 [Fusarium proliferatum ET1]